MSIVVSVMSHFLVLHETFSVSITNKVHIIQSHLKDYLTITKKGLGVHSDQLIEQMHQEVDKTLHNSSYWVTNYESEQCGEQLEKGINHFNSYNL